MVRGSKPARPALRSHISCELAIVSLGGITRPQPRQSHLLRLAAPSSDPAYSPLPTSLLAQPRAPTAPLRHALKTATRRDVVRLEIVLLELLPGIWQSAAVAGLEELLPAESVPFPGILIIVPHPNAECAWGVVIAKVRT